MIVVKEHASTVRNRTGKVRFARAMPTTNPRTGMLWERDWVLVSKKTRTIKSPENKIVSHASKKKGTIYLKTEASGILIDEESYSHEQNTARIADSLYIISRKIHPKTSSICQDRRGLILKSTKELGLLQLLATYR